MPSVWAVRPTKAAAAAMIVRVSPAAASARLSLVGDSVPPAAPRSAPLVSCCGGAGWGIRGMPRASCCTKVAWAKALASETPSGRLEGAAKLATDQCVFGKGGEGARKLCGDNDEDKENVPAGGPEAEWGVGPEADPRSPDLGAPKRDKVRERARERELCPQARRWV